MKNDKNKPSKQKDDNKLTEKQKKTLFILTVTGTIVMNVAISVFQVLKARKK